MQIFYLLNKIIEKNLYTLDDMLQKLDVYYLTGEITEQEYEYLMNLILPKDEVLDDEPVVDEDLPVVDEEITEEDSPVDDEEVSELPVVE